MRVFLDTNVIVGAVATRGLCADVFREVLAHHDLVISKDLLKEIERVLLGKLGVPAEIVSDVVAMLRESSILSEPARAVDLPINDPEDKALVSAALEAKAALFVTGDRELLSVPAVGSLDIVSPRTFWERSKSPLKKTR
jgi:putative PIN family toxin of toxin-antitoxin system